MSTTMAQRRKGGGGGSKSESTVMDPLEVVDMENISLIDPLSNTSQLYNANTPDENNATMNVATKKNDISNNNNTGLMMSNMVPASPAVVATVKRNFVGTGPFDRHWLNLDFCGLLCAAFTYGLHIFGAYAVCCVLLPPWMSATLDGVRSLTTMGQFVRLSFVVFTALAMISHLKAMTTDPGAVPPDAKPLPELDIASNGGNIDVESLMTQPKRLCRRCKTYKPQRAHHCSICRRCIIKMDHHCPWVNNCVGIGNHKYFLLFILYTFITCVYAVVLVVTRFASCMGDRRNYNSSSAGAHHSRHMHLTCLDHPTQLLTILGLLVESVLFGMFTCCMMFDQLEVIHSKLTHIDRLKGSSVGGTLEGIIEVFGIGSANGLTYIGNPRFRPDWLSPFVRVCFPPSLRDEVMGFCRNTCFGGSNGTDSANNNNSSAGANNEDGGLRLRDVI